MENNKTKHAKPISMGLLRQLMFDIAMEMTDNGRADYDGPTVVDTDCMSKAEQESETYKYLILQPDCKLYSQWDDKASIIF